MTTTSPIHTAGNYARHNDDRMRALRGTNHASVLAWPCRECHREFDVGYERLIHPTFNATCHECFTAARGTA